MDGGSIPPISTLVAAIARCCACGALASIRPAAYSASGLSLAARQSDELECEHPDPPDPPEELELLARSLLARSLGAVLLAGAMVFVPELAFAASIPAPTVTVPSNDTLPRDSHGQLIITGTAAPGAYITVIVEQTLAQLHQLKPLLDKKLALLARSCPNLSSCGQDTRADGSGNWTFLLPRVNFAPKSDYITVEENPGTAASHSWISAKSVVFVHVGPEQGANGAAEPSVFSDLAAFDWQSLTPAHVTITAGAALVLTLLLGFPTTLLNSALESSYEERSRRLKPLTDPLVRLGRRIRDRWNRATVNIPKPVTIVGWFLLAAIISGFADPSFGFNPESLRLLVSLFVAFGLLNVFGAYVTWWFTRTDEHTPRPTIPSRPSNLIILALTVLVARLIHLQPTLVFGTVLGVDMGAQLVLSKKARVILVGVAYSAGIGILAWLIYSLIPGGWTGFAAVAVRELFSQLAIAGIATLPITLLPFRALQGETLWKWQRIYWGLFYAGGMLLFLLILLPMPFSWGGVSEPLVAWILIFVIYSAVAVLGWLAVRYAWISSAERWMRAQRAARATPATTQPPTNKVEG